MAQNPCPHCGHTNVQCKQSREAVEQGVFRKRTYECASCHKRFTTEEYIVQKEGGVVVTPRHRAVMFMHEVEALVRRYFGNDGNLYGARNEGKHLARGAKRNVADED